MKRLIACILCLALLSVLMITTLAEDEADTAAPEDTEQVLTAENDRAETESEDTEQPIIEEDGYAETLQSSEAVTLSEDVSSSVLRFESLRDTIEQNNTTVKMMREQLDSMEDIDTDELDRAVEELEKLNSTVQNSLKQVSTALAQLQAQAKPASQPVPEMPEGTEGAEGTEMPEVPELPAAPDQNLLLIYSSLATALTADAVSINSQIITLEAQIDSIKSMKSTIEQTENTLNNAVDQIVKGAETLYIGIVTMESAAKDVQRGLDTLDRAVKIVEKQYELGMASLYDVESMRYQRSSVQNQMDSLKFQIKTGKVTLEGMCGLRLTGNIVLYDPPAPSRENINAVNFEDQLKTAAEHNVDIMNAKITYEDDDSDANEYALMAAEDAFESSFKIICMTVKEKERLIENAEMSVEFQKRTLEITKKKYELGMASYEDYMAGQSELAQAESDLHSAELALFSAYRDYIWARDKGIA